MLLSLTFSVCVFILQGLSRSVWHIGIQLIISAVDWYSQPIYVCDIMSTAECVVLCRAAVRMSRVSLVFVVFLVWCCVTNTATLQDVYCPCSTSDQRSPQTLLFGSCCHCFLCCGNTDFMVWTSRYWKHVEVSSSQCTSISLSVLVTWVCSQCYTLSTFSYVYIWQYFHFHASAHICHFDCLYLLLNHVFI